MSWPSFVLAHGHGARATDRAHIVGQPVEAILALRRTQARHGAAGGSQCRAMPSSSRATTGVSG
jgi:hypothetical protein